MIMQCVCVCMVKAGVFTHLCRKQFGRLVKSSGAANKLLGLKIFRLLAVGRSLIT